MFKVLFLCVWVCERACACLCMLVGVWYLAKGVIQIYQVNYIASQIRQFGRPVAVADIGWQSDKEDQ